MAILVRSYMAFPFSVGYKKGDYMVHDWKTMYVDTDTQNLGRFVILSIRDEDGEVHDYRFRTKNIEWLRKALKRGMKLAKMGDDPK